VFVNRVASHPELKATRALQRFLESNEDEFALEVALTTAVGCGCMRLLDPRLLGLLPGDGPRILRSWHLVPRLG
jgi:hypothetical protein